ncbi:MAG: DNA polymerase IV [candidate division Zixibacteria bacterium]|nr:DNA polymerase IV [candidate division Zixibacteria bacterium]
MGPFLYIDVDAFFASVEQSINPALVGRPVMVGGLKHERGVVACPSYEARSRGVRTGTTLHEAARLIPDGIFLRGDFNRYQDFSDRFYNILYSYTPDLVRISQDEACLHLGGIVRQFADPHTLAQHLQQQVWDELALSTSIGIAPSRIAAKIASEHRKPMGRTILTVQTLPGFMAPLPIRKIPGVGAVTEKILHEMGIYTAGQLSQVPEQYLKTVFGINGLKIAAYSRGEDGPLLRDYTVIRSVSRETGFADDITDHAILLSHFYYLLERAARKLRTLYKTAATVKIKFRYADFKTVEGATRIHPMSNDEGDIFPAVERMFTRLFTRRVGIRLVGVTLFGLHNYRDNESFLNDRIEKNRRLRRGLDYVRAREGFFSLMTGRTWALDQRYKRGDTGYELRTPGLSQ